MQQPKKLATYADLCAVPEHLVAEIIHGELVVSPRPAPRHARASSRLGRKLGPFDDDSGGPGGWVILDEPELHLGPEGAEVLVPDLAGWRRERMPELPVDEAFFTLAPDWVAEVLSPSTARRDRVDKLGIYAAERVGFAWLVDPVLQTLEVYRREGRSWLLLASHAGDAWVRAEPFESIELDLGALWAR